MAATRAPATPAVDVVTALLFALLAWRFVEVDGGGGLVVDWKLGPYLAIGAVLVVLSAIDIETHLLPNILVWPSIGAGLFTVLVLSGELDGGDGIATALLGGAVFGGFIGVTHLAYEPGMGRGDVKLALLLGLFIGWLQTDLVETARVVLYRDLRRVPRRRARRARLQRDPTAGESGDPVRSRARGGLAGRDHRLTSELLRELLRWPRGPKRETATIQG